MNLILIGYRACGKTCVGKRVSGFLGLPFYDTDELIQRKTGKTVRQIVQEGGWPSFRESEKAAISEVAGQDGVVIALGGGAVMVPGNVEALKGKGCFVWLQAEEETLRRRMKGDGASTEQRPPLMIPGKEDEKELLARRNPVYRALADLVIDTTGRSIDEVAREILAAFPLTLPSPASRLDPTTGGEGKHIEAEKKFPPPREIVS
jgi:shikimate kinase